MHPKYSAEFPQVDPFVELVFSEVGSAVVGVLLFGFPHKGCDIDHWPSRSDRKRVTDDAILPLLGKGFFPVFVYFLSQDIIRYC